MSDSNRTPFQRTTKRPRRPATGLSLATKGLALALFAAVTTTASGVAATDALRDASIEDLKRAYLLCNDAAMGGRLDGSGVMKCSLVYETLKQRAFDGDFDRLHAWSRQHPVARDTAR